MFYSFNGLRSISNVPVHQVLGVRQAHDHKKDPFWKRKAAVTCNRYPLCAPQLSLFLIHCHHSI